MILRNILILLAIVGLIATAILYNKVHHVNIPPEPPIKPAVNPYTHAVAASGIIEAVSENIAIGTPVSGVVKEVYVNVWDKVKAGQKLFEIDDRDIIGQLYVQEANVAIAQANLVRLQDQLKLLKSVTDERAVSKDEVRTRENDVLVSEAQLKQAVAYVKQSKLLLERLVVRAPKDGVILVSNLRTGEFIQSTATTPFMILGETDALQIRIDVDEQNAARITPNLPAVAYLKNNTRYKIPLKFVRIEPFVIPKKSLTGESVERVDTRVLQLIYVFENKLDFPVFVGQQVDVFIDTAKHDDAHPPAPKTNKEAAKEQK